MDHPLRHQQREIAGVGFQIGLQCQFFGLPVENDVWNHVVIDRLGLLEHRYWGGSTSSCRGVSEYIVWEF